MASDGTTTGPNTQIDPYIRHATAFLSLIQSSLITSRRTECCRAGFLDVDGMEICCGCGRPSVTED
jgi:hypothetical protein